MKMRLRISHQSPPASLAGWERKKGMLCSLEGVRRGELHDLHILPIKKARSLMKYLRTFVGGNHL